MNNKLTIQPIVRRNRINANNEIPIYLRIIINGKRSEFSTNLFIPENSWSSEKGKMKGNNEVAKTVNTHLDNLKLLASEKFS